MTADGLVGTNLSPEGPRRLVTRLDVGDVTFHLHQLVRLPKGGEYVVTRLGTLPMLVELTELPLSEDSFTLSFTSWKIDDPGWNEKVDPVTDAHGRPIWGY